MTARQMFERLGYKQRSCAEAYICYEKKDDFNERICIEFLLLRRVFYAQWNEYAHDITMKEFEAVQQQIKELGW